MTEIAPLLGKNCTKREMLYKTFRQSFCVTKSQFETLTKVMSLCSVFEKQAERGVFLGPNVSLFEPHRYPHPHLQNREGWRRYPVFFGKNGPHPSWLGLMRVRNIRTARKLALPSITCS